MASAQSLRRTWSWLLTAGAVCALAFVVLVSLIGLSKLPAISVDRASDAKEAEPITGQVAALHAVPRLVPGGFVQTWYADPGALEDESYVRSGMLALAEQL